MVWLGLAFPPEVAGRAMNPRTYTKPLLHFQTMLRSGAALTWYEIRRSYAARQPGSLMLRVGIGGRARIPTDDRGFLRMTTAESDDDDR